MDDILHEPQAYRSPHRQRRSHPSGSSSLGSAGNKGTVEHRLLDHAAAPHESALAHLADVTEYDPDPSEFMEDEFDDSLLAEHTSWLSKNAPLLMWSLLCIVMTVGQVVSLVKLGLRVPKFSYFITAFGAVCFNVPFAIYCYANHFLYKTITPSMRAWNLKGWLFLIGLFSALNGVLIVFANPHVKGDTQTLLLQSNIPVVILFSIVFLGAKFQWNHYMSAVMVIGGVVISLVPDFEDSSKFQSHVGWVFAFFCGSIPGVLSYIVQQHVFTKQEMDIGYLMFTSNVFQTISLVFLSPLNLIHGFGEVSSFRQLLTHFRDGTRCIFAGEHVLDDEGHPFNCENTLWIFLSFVMFYALSNFATAALVKYGNATYSILVSIASTITADVCFTFHFIMGDQTHSLSTFDLVALFVVLSGVVMYRLRTDIPKYPDESFEDYHSVPHSSADCLDGEEEFVDVAL
jgi:drug/metabolite transporter (DMT)-like permease